MTASHSTGYGRMAPISCLMVVVLRVKTVTCSSSRFILWPASLSVALLSGSFYSGCRPWCKARFYLWFMRRIETNGAACVSAHHVDGDFWEFIVRWRVFILKTKSLSQLASAKGRDALKHRLGLGW